MRIRDFQNGTYCVGQVVGVVSARVEGARTSPPERYTEQLLLEDMTSAHKFATDSSERAVLSEISGLGTSRTRASIIGGLIERGLLEKKQVAGRAGKKKTVIISSEHARRIARQLPATLTSVATTAKWELAFRMVEEGKATPQQMQAHMDRTLVAIVEDARRRGSAIASGAGVQQRPQAVAQGANSSTNSVTRNGGFGAQSAIRN